MGEYDKVIDFMLNNNMNYHNLYLIDDIYEKYAKNKSINSEFMVNQKKLLSSIQLAKKRGAKIKYREQDEDFIHIFVNNSIDIKNQLRLYLSPDRKNLLPLVVEIINKSIRNGKRTYIKYAEHPYRLDQLIFYLKDSNDMREKLELLEEIKKEKPELFQNMSQAPCWIYNSSMPNVYMAPDPRISDHLGRKTSYGYLFYYALNDTKNVLEYYYGIKENETLNKFRKDISFDKVFKGVFEEMLKRNGVLIEESNMKKRRN